MWSYEMISYTFDVINKLAKGVRFRAGTLSMPAVVERDNTENIIELTVDFVI